MKRLKNENEIPWNEVPKDVKKFMEKTDRLIDKKLKKIIANTNSEEVIILKEGNKIKIVEQEKALENSLFPTLVKKATKS